MRQQYTWVDCTSEGALRQTGFCDGGPGKGAIWTKGEPVIFDFMLLIIYWIISPGHKDCELMSILPGDQYAVEVQCLFRRGHRGISFATPWEWALGSESKFIPLLLILASCMHTTYHCAFIQCVPIKRKPVLSLRYLHCHASFNQTIYMYA